MSEKLKLKSCISLFSREMYQKLCLKDDAGWSGWDCEQHTNRFKEQLVLHALRGQWVDAANFAAFLWAGENLAYETAQAMKERIRKCAKE